jgi:quercetin 2,3-dioxygenase
MQVIHYHRQDDEWMYILSGSGTLLLNDATQGEKVEEHPISPGDFIGFKGGEGAENYAHSFRADQGVDLVYLVGGSR